MDATWDRDGEHLKLLGIFYYVKAALWALGCFAGGAYFVMAGVMVGAASSGRNSSNPPPEEVMEAMTWIFGTVGIVIVVASLAMAALSAYVGHCLQHARRRILCLVVAALHTPSFPIGTLLGIFTIIVLSRPSVVDRFEGRLPGPPPADEPPAHDDGVGAAPL